MLAGKQVSELAVQINRRPETLHKMLKETARRMGLLFEWEVQMKENRRNAAIRNLKKVNS